MLLASHQDFLISVCAYFFMQNFKKKREKRKKKWKLRCMKQRPDWYICISRAQSTDCLAKLGFTSHMITQILIWAFLFLPYPAVLLQIKSQPAQCGPVPGRVSAHSTYSKEPWGRFSCPSHSHLPQGGRTWGRSACLKYRLKLQVQPLNKAQYIFKIIQGGLEL